MLRDFGFELRAALVRTMMHRHFAVHKALKEWIDQVEHQQPKSLPCHFPESFSPTSPVDSLSEQHEESGVKWPEGNREQHEANHYPHQRDERSRSPCSKFVNPFARQPPLELRMLKSNDDLVSALDTWNTMMAKAAVQPRSDVVVTFVPRPSIVCESQLHQRIAAMGIDIYPKGSGPGQPPYGVQGGQAGQYSVSIVFTKAPLLKITIQMQRAKGNVVAKGKRSMFETSVVMTLLPYLGAPVSVGVGVNSKSRPKQDSKENIPLMKASTPSLFDLWKASTR